MTAGTPVTGEEAGSEAAIRVVLADDSYLAARRSATCSRRAQIAGARDRERAARRRGDRHPDASVGRELEILAFVARGHSNQVIANELVLTKRAVEKHINAIFLKLDLPETLDVSRRVKAALIYLAECGTN